MVDLFLGDRFKELSQTVLAMLDTIGDTSEGAVLVDLIDGVTVSDDPGAIAAFRTLNEVYGEMSSEFWNFNTVEVDIDADGSGRYMLPDHPFEVVNDGKAVETHGVANVRVCDQSSDLDLIYLDVDNGQTKPFLFNRKTGTETGLPATKIKAEIAYYIAWDRLPFAARYFCFIRAARKFQLRSAADEALLQFTAQDESSALVQLKKHDLASQLTQTSYFNGPGIQGVSQRWPR